MLQKRKDSQVALNLGGDGRYDSPGFRARFCYYVVMDLGTREILGFFTAIKHQVTGGSANMEPFACKTVLLSLVNFGLNIASFTTDRSSSIKNMLQSCPEFRSIAHEFDPWHMIKSIMKDVWKYCKNKNCEKLALWRESINLMLWWSFATSSWV